MCSRSLYSTSIPENSEVQNNTSKTDIYTCMNYGTALSLTLWNRNWSSTFSMPRYLLHEISTLLYFAIKENLDGEILYENLGTVLRYRFYNNEEIFNKLMYYTKMFFNIISKKLSYNCEGSDFDLYQKNVLSFEELFLINNGKCKEMIMSNLINCMSFDFKSRLVLAAYVVTHTISAKKFKQCVIQKLNRRKRQIKNTITDGFVKTVSMKVINNTQYLTLALHSEVTKYHNVIKKILQQNGMYSNSE